MEQRTALLVPVGELAAFPGNPRRGDVAAIAASLEAHGQYTPLVVNRRTGYVLAGNHTLAAAKRLGWTEVSVTYVDVDDDHALRIVLADNRTADLASYDDGALSKFLHDLPVLDGTGFTTSDLDTLDGLYNSPVTPSGPSVAPDAGERADEPDAAVAIGPHCLTVERDQYDAWAASLSARFAGKAAACAAECRRLLGFPETRRVANPDKVPQPSQPTYTDCESVAIDSLTPFAGNPREGDVGAIIESLERNGQYRPIVANLADGHILKGNHTWMAAKALGWTTVFVSWVHVTDEEARAIVIADNRTSDLASYDPSALADLVASLADLSGTGWTGDDLDDLLAGGPARPSKPVGGPVACRVGDWRFRVQRADYEDWERALPAAPLPAIAFRLGLPPDGWRPTV